MGPAISVMDADIGAANNAPARAGARSAADARRAAQAAAVGQEACSMLGAARMHIANPETLQPKNR